MIKKYYNPEGGGGGTTGTKPEVAQPEGYAPLSVKNRKDWNDFLDYLSSKGLGGSDKLDQRNQTLGLNALADYKKQKPDFSITPDMIKNIQYEQYLLRKGDSFPTLNPSELTYIRNGLAPQYLNRNVSPVDSWLGSLTSRQYYPQGIRATPQGRIDFGVDMENYVKSINNPEIAKNYPLIPN